MDIGGVEDKNEDEQCHEHDHQNAEEANQDWGYGDINAAYGTKGWGKQHYKGSKGGSKGGTVVKQVT